MKHISCLTALNTIVTTDIIYGKYPDVKDDHSEK